SEEDLIFLGIYRRAGNQLEPERRLVNPDLLVKYEILSADIYGLTGKYSESFMRTFSGQTVLINASPGFKTPIVGLGIPFEESGGQRTILVAYLKMDLFLENFQMSGITETFMVNQDGIVVAHPDNNVVLSSADASNMEIVRHMQTSPVNNGLLRYENDDGHSYLGSFNKLDTLGVGIISTVPEDKALEEVYNIQRRNLYLTIIIVSLALIVVFFFSKQISRPILILVRAARQISAGNFALNLVPEHRDELGLLTNSFNHMARGLQERANLKDSFGKFVNKELAELSMAGAISLGGERKECAIFFSDIRGFTAMSERLRPEEVVEFLNEYFTDMVRCVNETHGIVDKFIGDAIMAHWGALKTYGNNTENAINAALMMRAALIAFNRGRGTARRPVLHMGCGINTGHVIAGQIGSDERLEYTVIGDAVNLASRVEALTKHFGVDIIVTNHSLDLVRGLYHAVEMDKMRVKGKAKPITVYAVLGRQDDPDCPKDLKELRRIVGIDYKPSAGKKAGEEVKYEPA
ncbi:MAG: HAMP domain-containing protein, partial [Leptospiraceae bacterium]|nr:HAMP domain-containing protein [Leptospiraceae bacterium]